MSLAITLQGSIRHIRCSGLISLSRECWRELFTAVLPSLVNYSDLYMGIIGVSEKQIFEEAAFLLDYRCPESPSQIAAFQRIILRE